MKYEEMEEKIKQLKKEYLKNVAKIKTEYAYTNNPYKIDDIIEDHYHIIKIQKTVAISNIMGKPECKYYGIQLTKKLVPCKNNRENQMYQSNVKRKIIKD